jgi:hypothetical protein
MAKKKPQASIPKYEPDAEDLARLEEAKKRLREGLAKVGGKKPKGEEPRGKVKQPEVSLDYDEHFSKEYISAYTLHQIRKLTEVLAARNLEALNLYEPLPEQKRFHKCMSPYRLVRGSNRAGKTIAAAVEVARCVTGQDPYKKFPTHDGTAFIVGKDQRHVGKVLYEKLFKPGSFKIIRDERTKKWRAFRPWVPDDSCRADQAKPAPPLIPPRMVVEVAWENKKENVPSIIRLSNGWDLHFYSSLGKPPQGSPIDLFWFDEEIIDPNWYPEMAARILDRNGKGIWSATPQAGTEQLYELHERAEKEAQQEDDLDRRRINEFVVLLEENKHIDLEAKRSLAADLTDEEARVRIGGEYAITSYKVYPNFNMTVHGHPLKEVSNNWTRYAYIDPGHRTCAVLFCAVPPPGEVDFDYLLYDELYIKDCNAAIFAQELKRKIVDQQIQAFMIDAHMAAQTEIGVGKTVMQQYTEEMADLDVRSIATGSSFLLANGDVRAGVLAVQGLLRVRDRKGPAVRVMEQKLPNFLFEIKRYHRKRIAGVVQEEPDTRKDNHVMDCLRYLALHEPKWVKPREVPKSKSGPLEYIKRKQAKRRDHNGESYTNLGPGKGTI